MKIAVILLNLLQNKFTIFFFFNVQYEKKSKKLFYLKSDT